MSINMISPILKQYHYSLTKPRQQIYAVLSHSEPLTMQELITALPGLDRTTVYRTVELFESLGIVQRLQIGWKYKLELSNDYQDHHHHLTCMNCGRTFALPEDDLLEERLQALALSRDFQPLDHQLEIRGRCTDCQKPS